VEEKYDSRLDTYAHVKRVNHFLVIFIRDLLERGINHDTSKFEDPEKAAFDKYTPILKQLQYGSKEYYENLEHIQEALVHHYANNTHHPEHYGNQGIDGMNLMDIVEMYADWSAAVERTKDGTLPASILHNKTRFNMSDQLVSIFLNTINLTHGESQ